MRTVEVGGAWRRDTVDRGELDGLSGLEVAARLRSGRVRCVEVLDHYVAAIERLDPHLNAFTDRTLKRARLQAMAAQARIDRGDRGALPPFAGVPFAIKDCDPVFGTFTRVGSRAFRYVVAPFDAPSVGRLKRGGFVLTGKTACSELTLMPVTEPDIHAPTRNPWSRSHSAGGSSGGAAAAVASGMLPLAHATDGGGSIRIPAAFCHLFGFKSSRALPNFYEQMDPLHMAAVGAVTHTVEDAAAVFDLLAGAPTARPGLDDAPRHPLRVGLLRESPLTEVDPEIAAATERVAATLEAMGHHVDAVSPLDGSLDEFLPIYQRLAANPPVPFERVLQPVTRWLRDPGKSVTPAQARAVKDGLERRVLGWFGDLDVLVTPTVGQLAPRVGQYRELPPGEQFRQAAAYGAFTAAFNLTGQPAASLPAGVSRDGRPIGVQVVGRPRGDAELLRGCRARERALPWRDRRAAV